MGSETQDDARRRGSAGAWLAVGAKKGLMPVRHEPLILHKHCSCYQEETPINSTSAICILLTEPPTGPRMAVKTSL